MLRGSRAFLGVTVVLAVLTTMAFSWGGLSGFLAKHTTLREVLAILPYTFLGVLGFLGLRMHQYRILFTAALLALGYAFLTLRNPWLAQFSAYRSGILVTSVPLSLLALTFLRPGKLFSKFALLDLVAILLPTVLVTVFRRKILMQTIHWPASWHLKIPDLAFLFAIAYSGTVFTGNDRYFRAFHAALIIALIPLFTLLNHAAPTAQASAVAFSGIGLILLYAMYHLYWSKVYVDELTGIPNRRALDERLAALDSNYWLAMCDIDHFKKFNDSYGHDEGDNVLRYVASHLNQATASRAYRYGGEEFCVVIEKMGPKESFALLDGARAGLAAKEFGIRGSEKKVKVTLSVGMATTSEAAPTPDKVILEADRLLYRAKEKGRNRVIAE